MTYVFYDTETSGIKTHYDQILQFAAIVTDENFEETERFDIQMRLSPHVVPSPKALLINGIAPGECYSEQRMTQFDGLSRVHAFIQSHTPSIFAGWNTISFDEEILRHGFYQQLLYPYPTSGKNGRMDIMRVARAVHALRPGVISVPLGVDGKESFKLENISSANGYVSDRSHEAVSDTEASIFMAKQIKCRAPDIWSAFVQTSKKSSAMQIIRRGDPCVVITGWKEHTRQSVGVSIGVDPENEAYHYFADLDTNLSEFQSLSSEERMTWFDRIASPVNKVKCNASPLIIPIDDVHEYEDQTDDYEDKASILKQNSKLCAEICAAFHDHIKRDYDNRHVEDRLYDGFPNGQVERQQMQFLRSDWSDRADIARRMLDIRHKKLSMRLIAENAPFTLTEMERQKYSIFVRSRLRPNDEMDIPWRTIGSALDELSLLQVDDKNILPEELSVAFYERLGIALVLEG